MFKRLCSQLIPQPRPIRKKHCIPIPADIVRDPDPAIYTQELELLSGRNPTFDNPDIITVATWPIRPHETIDVEVRNLSPDSAANNTRVDVHWSPWGIGMHNFHLGSMVINLARSGFPGAMRNLKIPTPADVIAEGRFCVFVDIVHPYDRDRSNNHGIQGIDGFQTSQTEGEMKRRGQFIIPVRNPTYNTASIQLTVTPSKWDAIVVPSHLVLGPNDQRDVQFSVTIPINIPASPPGTLATETFSVYATLEGKLLGGVALLVLVDD